MKTKSKSAKSAPASFKIEKGVSIPPRVAMGSMSPVSVTMLSMEVNDSFLISDMKPETVMSSVRSMNRRMRKQKKSAEFTARRTTGGVRVWRVK